MRDYTKVSDFLAISEDARKIVEKIVKNENICKLLKITDVNALTETMTEEEKIKLIDKYIILNSHFPEDNEMKNFIMIDFDHFSPSENPEYISCTINFSIFCNVENWEVKNKGKTYFRLYYIAHEILKDFSKSKMTGIGNLEYIGGESIILGTDVKYKGIVLSFATYNGVPKIEKIYGTE